MIAQRVLASVIVPHLKVFREKEDFFWGVVVVEKAFTFLYDSDALFCRIRSNRKPVDFPCVWWRSAPMPVGEESVLMIVLRQAVIAFGEIAGSCFLGLPGRPVPASVILGIVTTKVL